MRPRAAPDIRRTEIGPGLDDVFELLWLTHEYGESVSWTRMPTLTIREQVKLIRM